MGLIDGALESLGDFWEGMNTPMWDNPVEVKSTVKNITDAVKSAPAAVANAVPSGPFKGAAKSEIVAKGVLGALAGTCILAGAAFIYRGLSQNCSFRNMIKTPISLLPKDEGAENEQRSGPLGWASRIKSAAQRIALPAITGLGPILVGAFVLWNMNGLAKLATGDFE